MVVDPVVIHPLGITLTRSYLLSRSEVTSLVGQRVSMMMPDATALPRWPAVRLTEIITTEATPRVWTTMLLQADCWAATQPDADRLARVLIGVLRASANYVTAQAVMGESENLTAKAAPDSSLNPPQPRSIVTGHVWLRPH
jgi:hypothetical protein